MAASISMMDRDAELRLAWESAPIHAPTPILVDDEVLVTHSG